MFGTAVQPPTHCYSNTSIQPIYTALHCLSVCLVYFSVSIAFRTDQLPVHKQYKSSFSCLRLSLHRELRDPPPLVRHWASTLSQLTVLLSLPSAVQLLDSSHNTVTTLYKMKIDTPTSQNTPTCPVTHSSISRILPDGLQGNSKHY